MIRVIYNQTTKEISNVLFAEGETLFNQQINAMIQGDIETVFSLANTIGVNVNPIIEFLNQEGIDTSNIAEKARLSYKKFKGRAIVDRYLLENETIVISSTENMGALSSFLPLKILLESGALATAKDLLEYQIPAEAFILTPDYDSQQERKQSFIDEIQSIIDTLL